MRSRRLVALVLLCSLPLPLPRSWGCICPPVPQAALAKGAPARRACCPCTGGECCGCEGGRCCSCAGRKLSSDPAKPERPDVPVKRCPCADRDTTLPSGPEQDSPALPPELVPVPVLLPGDAVA